MQRQGCYFIVDEEVKHIYEPIHEAFEGTRNAVLSVEGILAKIDHPEARDYLKKVLESGFFDGVRMPDMTIRFIKDDLWRVNGSDFSSRIHALDLIAHLPWKPGQELDLIEDKVVETVDIASNKAFNERKERKGFTCEDILVDKKLIPRIEEKIIEKLGRHLVFDFDTILEVASVTEQVTGEAFDEELDAHFEKKGGT